MDLSDKEPNRNRCRNRNPNRAFRAVRVLTSHSNPLEGGRRRDMPKTRKIGIISDTHGLMRPQALEALRGCERIIHAGDVGSQEVLDRLDRVAPVTAVAGNTDYGDFARDLPETQAVEIGATWVYVLHDLHRLDLDPKASGFRVVVFGHSHRPASEIEGDVLYLNPGSAGPRRFHLPVTVAVLEVRDDAVGANIIPLSV